MAAIVKLKSGEAPTLLHADFANTNVMVPLHALKNLQVSPMGSGVLVMAGEVAILSLDPSAIVAAGGGRVPLQPFVDNEGDTLRVSFQYGKIFDMPLDSFGPVTITATRYFYARLTVNGAGAAVSLALVVRTTAIVGGALDTFTVHYIELGRAVVSGGAITAVDRVLGGSQGYERCGFADDYSHNHWLT